MKKISLLTLVVALAAMLPGRAQDVSGPYVGVTTGFQSTWLFDDKLWDDLNYEKQNTYNRAPIGFVAGYKFNKNSSFQLELIRSNMGAKYDIRQENPPTSGTYEVFGERRIELTYWSVPVLYKITSGENVRFNFHLGPQFSFLSDARDESTYDKDGQLRAKKGSTEISPDEVQGVTADGRFNIGAGTRNTIGYNNGKEDFRKTDIAATLGLGIEVDIVAGLYASANLRVAYGFSDIRNDAQIDRVKANDFHATRNNVVGGLQLGVHYIFK